MVSRRKNNNPLATSPDARWLIVMDRQQRELSSQRIAPFADLRSVMNHEAARWTAQGWTVEGDGTWGSFFINMGGERWLVMLTPGEHADPQHSNPGTAR